MKTTETGKRYAVVWSYSGAPYWHQKYYATLAAAQKKHAELAEQFPVVAKLGLIDTLERVQLATA